MNDATFSSPAPAALPHGATRHEPRGTIAPRAPDQLAEGVRAAARALGFAAVGFTTVARFDEDAARLDRWRRQRRHGEMSFLEEPPDRASPLALLGAARTLISVALPHTRDVVPLGALTGKVARYAQGADYHVVLKRRLRELADRIANLVGPVVARACVDTAPLLEHAAAARAGIGFTGRNTLTIVPGTGSYVVLGELLVDAELPADPPATTRCGTCTRCLDACPTGAFVGPHEIDARRCISYLTIELRGPMPRDLRPFVGTRVFGCDVCQEVCPYNRPRRPVPPDPELVVPHALATPDLVELLWMGSAGHRRLTRGTAFERVSRPRLARNAAVALGNSADPAAIEAVARALRHHPIPLVRGHAAWALGRLDPSAGAPLRRAEREDPDPSVREEARLALAALP